MCWCVEVTQINTTTPQPMTRLDFCEAVQLDSVPHIPTMKTFSTQGNCSVTVSDLDLLRILFHGDSISREYEARYPFNQKLGIIYMYTLHRGRKFSYSRFSETETLHYSCKFYSEYKSEQVARVEKVLKLETQWSSSGPLPGLRRADSLDCFYQLCLVDSLNWSSPATAIAGIGLQLYVRTCTS